MIADITTAVSGLISAISGILSPVSTSGTTGEAVTWIALLALPVLGGSVAMARKLIKKAR